MKDEEKLTKMRALELWDKNLIDNIEVGTFKGLQEIHRFKGEFPLCSDFIFG